MRRTTLILSLFFALVLPGAAPAQEMPVPVEVQQALFAKILTYERTLQAGADEAIVVGVVYQSRYRESLRTRDALLEAAEAEPLTLSNGTPLRFVPVELTETDALEAQLEAASVDVLYVAPLRAQRIDVIAALCRTRRILTLTGVPGYLDEGLSVSIGLKEGRRPEILINLQAAEAQGAQFSARLLNLARIVGP